MPKIVLSTPMRFEIRRLKKKDNRISYDKIAIFLNKKFKPIESIRGNTVGCSNIFLTPDVSSLFLFYHYPFYLTLPEIADSPPISSQVLLAKKYLLGNGFILTWHDFIFKSSQDETQLLKEANGTQPNRLVNFVKLIIFKRISVSFTYNNIYRCPMKQGGTLGTPVQ